MDRPSHHHHGVRGDNAKLRRTQSIAASAKLRRTQTISGSRALPGEDSSVSSLGSFPEADLVAQQFTPSAKLSRQQTVAAPGPIFNAASREPRKKGRESRANYMQVHQKQCPHCYKEFSNSWAVPKHVQRIHDRTGQYHCPRCTFKAPYVEWLAQHEKEAHRKCPYCRQLFVLLNKHVNTCPKRPR